VKTQFNLNYRADKVFYPSHTEIEDFSQSYSTQLEHHSSEHTALYWNFIAGRLTGVAQYLPAIIPIGSGGVAQGSSAANAQETTTSNIATSLGFTHDVSENSKVLGTLTAGWIEQAQGTAPGTPRQISRNEIAGIDLQYQRAISLRTTLGGEVTQVYIRGLAPLGHENYVAVEGTYIRQLTDHLDLRAAAGPLFNSTSGNGVKSENDVTYAASADIQYRIQHTLMAFDFSRVFQLGYQQTASIGNQISASFDRELSHTLDVTVDARYVRSDSSSINLRQSVLGITGRVNKRIAPNVLLFLSASRSQQKTPAVLVNSNSFNRDDVFGGVTILLGNPLYSRGVH
jgi:hypothetical protein